MWRFCSVMQGDLQFSVIGLAQVKLTIGFGWFSYHQLHFVVGFVSTIYIILISEEIFAATMELICTQKSRSF
jgi:hypothetical protein